MTDYTGSNTPADQRDLWRTPPALFYALDAEFCFQLDAAAAPHNALCRKFITEEQNTLKTPWADYLSIPGYVWLNPPYSDITPFVKKAAAESLNQIGTVMLVPADPSVGWFKEARYSGVNLHMTTSLSGWGSKGYIVVEIHWRLDGADTNRFGTGYRPSSTRDSRQ